MGSRLRAGIAGVWVLSLALFTLLGQPETSPAQAAELLRYEPGQVIVRLNDASALNALHLLYGTTTLDQLYGRSDTFLLSTPTGVNPAQLAAQLALHPQVVFSEPNFLTDTPEDSSTDRIYGWAGDDPAVFEGQTAASSMDLAAVHQYSAGAGTVVAVLDTGAQLDHPVLSGALHPLGFDFVDRDPFPDEETNGRDDDGDGRIDEGYGHGTFVAGIIRLAAPQADVMVLRVLNSDGRGNIFWTAGALLYAVQNGADVINLSLGTSSSSALLRDAVREAAHAHVVVTAAAGNSGVDSPQYPAAETCAVGTASVNDHSKKSDFSNYGSWVGLSALGEEIYSAFPVNGYAQWSGTSMTAPLAASQASLLLSVEPNATLEQVGRWMGATSKPLDARNPAYRGGLGQGQINLLGSLQAQAAGTNLPAERSVFAACRP